MFKKLFFITALVAMLATATLTFAAGAMLMVVLARLISRHGVGNGLCVLVGAQVASSLSRRFAGGWLDGGRGLHENAPALALLLVAFLWLTVLLPDQLSSRPTTYTDLTLRAPSKEAATRSWWGNCIHKSIMLLAMNVIVADRTEGDQVFFYRQTAFSVRLDVMWLKVPRVRRVP